MNSISWDNVESLSDAEITYLLYQEGKSIKSISCIRRIDRHEIERHLLECRIKYRIFEGVSSVEDVILRLKRCTRDERSAILSMLPEKDISDIESYSLKDLFNCSREDCSFYIWLLGEIKSNDAVQPISTFLRCADGNIKRACCSALGKIGDMRAEDVLIKAAGDERPQVREYAVKALARIKSIKASDVFNRIIADPMEKEYVKRAAKGALEHVNKAGDNNV